MNLYAAITSWKKSEEFHALIFHKTWKTSSWVFFSKHVTPILNTLDETNFTQKILKTFKQFRRKTPHNHTTGQTDRWQGIHRTFTSWIQKTKTNLNKVKPVKNIEKNLLSFREMSLIQYIRIRNSPPSREIQEHACK